MGITDKGHYPSKGERVTIYVDEVELKSGETALFPVELNKMAQEKAKSFNVADLEAMLAAPTKIKKTEAEVGTVDSSAIVKAM